MPEIVTKYPDVLLKELKDAGGKCGENVPKQILTSCPSNRFCALPTGEICVYDVKELKNMTQISPDDWQAYVTGVPSMLSFPNMLLLFVVFIIGGALGYYFKPKNF